MQHETDLTTLIDELGKVRGKIRSLRAREARLREQVIEARPNGPVTGQVYTVTIRQSDRKTFDHHALPDTIRTDPRYWKVTPTKTVITKLSTNNRASDPPSYGTGAPSGETRKGFLYEVPQDYQVIEPF